MQRRRIGAVVTTTPAAQALSERLRAKADLTTESPAPHLSGDIKFYVYDAEMRALLNEAALALTQADGDAVIGYVCDEELAEIRAGRGGWVTGIEPDEPCIRLYAARPAPSPWESFDDDLEARTSSVGPEETARINAAIAATQPEPAPDTERAGVPDMQEWYLSWPVDIRKKLSLHDLQRMWKTLRHPCNNVADWEIDSSAGRPILTYQKCSVIEDEQARYVLGLIAQDVTSAPRAGSVVDDAIRTPTGKEIERAVMADTNRPCLYNVAGPCLHPNCLEAHFQTLAALRPDGDEPTVRMVAGRPMQIWTG